MIGARSTQMPALLTLAMPAFAHAFLTRAKPPVGSASPVSPPAVTISFTEPVEPTFSTIEVQDARGGRVDRADPYPAGDGGRQLAVSLPTLPPGTYTVIWRATSVDTHKTEGRYDFSVTR
jgi:methionine-rich copper-binding protein CopC